MSLSIPHLALPFQIVGVAAATTEQDSPEEIRDCVTAIIRTPIGFREELPDFGAPDQTFEQTIDETLLEAAVNQWEPRASAAAASSQLTLPDYIQQITVQIGQEGT